MKKSVILIISTLSLIAIILIGLVFQRAEVYNVTVYVEQVACVGVRIGDEEYSTFYNDNTDRYLIENPNESGKEVSLSFVYSLTMVVIYEVLPYNATNSTVSFSIDSNNSIATIGETDGKIIFFSPGIATFTLLANDNSNETAKLKIRVKAPES